MDTNIHYCNTPLLSKTRTQAINLLSAIKPESSPNVVYTASQAMVSWSWIHVTTSTTFQNEASGEKNNAIIRISLWLGLYYNDAIKCKPFISSTIIGRTTDRNILTGSAMILYVRLNQDDLRSGLDTHCYVLSCGWHTTSSDNLISIAYLHNQPQTPPPPLPYPLSYLFSNLINNTTSHFMSITIIQYVHVFNIWI